MSSGLADSPPSSRPSDASEPNSSPTSRPTPKADDAAGNSGPARKSGNDGASGPMMHEDDQHGADVGEVVMRAASGSLPGQEQSNSRRTTSGGFLLQPLHAAHRQHSKRDSLDRKSRRAVVQSKEAVESSAGRPTETTPQLNRDGPTDTSPLAANGHAGNAFHIEKRKKLKGKARAAVSPSTSQSSSMAAESSNPARSPTMNAAVQDDSQVAAAAAAAPSVVVDPSAIVRMALSLNESRRLNLAPGRLASNPSPLGRRSTSARIDAQPPTALQGHFGDHRESLRRSMQSRGSSRNASPTLESSSTPRPDAFAVQNATSFDQDVSYTFSSGTIARAETARNFIELHDEYRRLLEILPPLSPATNSTQEPALGRPYNPLQYIRNRKIRGRVRALLDPEIAGWDNITEVRAWVDNTENEARLQGFTAGDIAVLPPWHGPAQKASDTPSQPSPSDMYATAAGALTKKRPKLDWTFSPQDLLADAYWLEQDAHKLQIEAHDGNKIFTDLQRPERLDAFESIRLSHETQSDVNDSGLEMDETEMTRSPATYHPSQGITSRDTGLSTTTQGTHNESNLSRVRRRLLPRRRTASRRASFSSGSNDEDAEAATNGKISLGRQRGINIGPLERHMSNILKAELSRTATLETAPPESADRDAEHQRRGGVSTEYNDQAMLSRAGSQDHGSPTSSISTDRRPSPRISVEDPDGIVRYANGHAVRPSGNLSPVKSTSKGVEPRFQARPLNFLHRRGKSKQQNHIAENDFAVTANQTADGAEPVSPASGRSSLDVVSRFSSHKHASSLEMARDELRRKSIENVRGQASGDTSSMRFFKGGRIGDIVRGELPHAPKFISKKERHSYRRDSTASSKNEAMGTNVGANDNDVSLGPLDMSKVRSRSVDDLGQSPIYRAPDLPTFRSANDPTPEKTQSPSSAGVDHISRQLADQREQRRNRKSRHNHIAPPSLMTDSSTDVSPNTSSYNLSKLNTGADSTLTAQSGVQSSSRSSSGVRVADQRLKMLLRDPGGVGHAGLPVTALSKVNNTKPARHSRLSGYNRLADSQQAPEPPVTTKDINHVRTLLISSGIKAHNIVRRAEQVHEPPSDWLIQAAKAASSTLRPVPYREEHVLAARLLSNNLENAASAFDKAADEFRNDTCHKLQAQIDDLRERVNSDLTPRIRTCGDEADAFIARLTTSHTLAVKQVSDSVDLMLRSRWRRLRWLRRVGFKLLELMLVALMWWIWLFVFVFRAARGLVGGFWGGFKWLLWC